MTRSSIHCCATPVSACPAEITRQGRFVVRQRVDVIEQKRRGIGGFARERHLRDRLHLPRRKLTELRIHAGRTKLITQRHSQRVNEMCVVAIGLGEGADERADIVGIRMLPEGVGGAAADEGVGVDQTFQHYIARTE